MTRPVAPPIGLINDPASFALSSVGVKNGIVCNRTGKISIGNAIPIMNNNITITFGILYIKSGIFLHCIFCVILRTDLL